MAVYDWHRNQEPIKEEGYTTDLIAAEVVRLLKKQDPKQPFFFYVPFNAIHGPLDPAPRNLAGNDPRGAALKCLDEAVGRILSALTDNGFKHNTLVIFTNDNGAPNEDWNRPFRGGKNSPYEGALHVPCLIRWPLLLSPGQRHGLVLIADFYPTLVRLAGGTLQQARRLDGMDLRALWFEGTPSPRQEIIFEVAGSVRPPTIRSGPFKLINHELYNLQDDPHETTNLANRHPKRVKELRTRLNLAAQERPLMGEKPLLMQPVQPYTYSRDENESPPEWLVERVDEVRAQQRRQRRPAQRLWMPAPSSGD